MSTKPTLFYFPLRCAAVFDNAAGTRCRGRGEVMKLILAYKGVEYDVVPDMPDMKTNKTLYPFGQCPRYKDGELDMCQSNTIIRYLGRKYGLEGKTEADKVVVDMMVEAVESLRSKYVELIYVNKLSDEAKAVFNSTHISKASVDGRNGGAHLDYLAAFIRNGKDGLLTGELTVGDLAIWDLLDTLMRILKDEITAEYPELVAFHAKVAEVPGIKEYLASPLRMASPNAVPLG
ncbi:hypothetical protein QJQ45_024589 [Haematococcus lacustris]|nr:hypothetical protein QJQ45_024589 [Haematococcus lacustris]